MRHVLPALLAVLSFGCSSGPPKQVDDPSSNEFGSSNSSTGDSKPSSDSKSEATNGADGKGKRDESIPDDYSLTPGDCDALGKQFASVVKADLMNEMGAKVSEKQKAQAEEAIDKNVGKQATAWIEGCQKTLAGNIVDRRMLKCAMDTKTAAAFKACLGDDSKAGAAGAAGSKPKKK